jgi:hypothetical protein
LAAAEDIQGESVGLNCFIGIHDYAGWSSFQELPVWKDGRGHMAIGYQPTERRIYSDGKGGSLEKVTLDLSYKLSGKFIEQRRTCRMCYRVQVGKQIVTV